METCAMHGPILPISASVRDARRRFRRPLPCGRLETGRSLPVQRPTPGRAAPSDGPSRHSSRRRDTTRSCSPIAPHDRRPDALVTRFVQPGKAHPPGPALPVPIQAAAYSLRVTHFSGLRPRADLHRISIGGPILSRGMNSRDVGVACGGAQRALQGMTMGVRCRSSHAVVDAGRRG